MIATKKRSLFLIILLSLVFILGTNYFAFAYYLTDTSSIRCRGGIIKIGDTKVEVEKKCGEPTSEEEDGRLWIYNWGPHELIKYLTFVGIKLHRIQVGEFGF